MPTGKIASSLILLTIVFTVTIAGATTEDNYKNDTNILPTTSESTHTENGYTTRIITNPTTTGTYAKENGYNLDLTLNPEGIGGKRAENHYQIDLIPEKTFPEQPDISITNVTTSKSVVGQNFTSEINATISNKALNYESLYITICANLIIIRQTQITLTSRSSTTITLTWNTTGVAKGNYTVKAEATPVPGETNLVDNTLVDGWVVVTIPGDIEGDYDVDYKDLFILAKAYGCSISDECYVPNADLDCNGKIDYLDLFILARNYGKET